MLTLTRSVREARNPLGVTRQLTTKNSKHGNFKAWEPLTLNGYERS